MSSFVRVPGGSDRRKSESLPVPPAVVTRATTSTSLPGWAATGSASSTVLGPTKRPFPATLRVISPSILLFVPTPWLSILGLPLSRMTLPNHSPKVGDCDARVERCRLNRRMPEQLLHMSHVGAALEQVRRVR